MSHLWQSTIFGLTAAAITFTLRKNHPRVRYWVWAAASLKFLIPFSLLINLGSRLSWRIPEYAPPPAVTIKSTARPPDVLPLLLMGSANEGARVADIVERLYPISLAAWMFGCATVLLRWISLWTRMRSLVRRASPVSEGRELELLRSFETNVRLRKPLRSGFANRFEWFPLVLWLNPACSASFGQFSSGRHGCPRSLTGNRVTRSCCMNSRTSAIKTICSRVFT